MKETERSVRSRNALIEAISKESTTLAARLVHELEVIRKRHEQEEEELQQRHLNELLTVYSSYNKKIRPPYTDNLIARQDKNTLSENKPTIEKHEKARGSVTDINTTFKKRKRDQILSLDFRDASISQAEIDDAIRQRNRFLEQAGAGQKVPHYLYQYNIADQRGSWGSLPSISSVFPDYFDKHFSLKHTKHINVDVSYIIRK
ncbi:hypothetical protein E3Q16_04325 [Wallemia mellicola]|uniref:Uncharacterized protein n=1 Tax=Wallemia mellicola TaxID=1708541 RepID=A0A4T0LBT2_9BASI|nr:hypothetical protein E3Q24_04372 [Wallemia mellicola]TIB78374.1 hypothetical protein E3Q21_04396 [Wallemia mellicola]TIB82928.1 hypothetical protein E3Q20_04374 [Wallemia mellicola]TIB98354.1 hypothetical protein E3Q16_04325 [Wallemia mellicola]TIC06961.1 hypothetical protein E3Q14_04393 [Wallemia mellicola]